MKLMGLIVLVLVSVLVLFLLVILFVKIRLRIIFRKPEDGAVSFILQAELFGGRTVKKLYPRKNVTDKDEPEKSGEEKREQSDRDFIQKLRAGYAKFLEYKYIYQLSAPKIRKNIFAEKICLNVSFGLDDAAKTGVASGLAWGMVYSAVAFLSSVIRISEPQINITPVFDKEYINADGECIISVTLANIIGILITLGKNKYIINKKYTKKVAFENGNSN